MNATVDNERNGYRNDGMVYAPKIEDKVKIIQWNNEYGLFKRILNIEYMPIRKKKTTNTYPLAITV